MPELGAVYCIEASRLARNGRDWHHLIDLCALDASGTEPPQPAQEEAGCGVLTLVFQHLNTTLRTDHSHDLCADCAKADRRGGASGGWIIDAHHAALLAPMMPD